MRKKCVGRENKKGPPALISRRSKTLREAQGDKHSSLLKDTNPLDASPGPSGNEQWEPDQTLRPHPDKQTPSPAAVRPNTAASHLQKKKKKFSLGHR